MANLEQMTVGGGCFWCLEAVFEELDGVVEVVSGYAGGEVENPSYELVCTGTTGHAEVVQVTYDPERVSFRDLLNVFFSMHDPTTLNRQGADVGTQYRSVIFHHNSSQRSMAVACIAEWDQQQVFGKPIVTEVSELGKFWPAEGYHQGYFRGHRHLPYCQVVIAPKLTKFRREFPQKLRNK